MWLFFVCAIPASCIFPEFRFSLPIYPSAPLLFLLLSTCALTSYLQSRCILFQQHSYTQIEEVVYMSFFPSELALQGHSWELAASRYIVQQQQQPLSSLFKECPCHIRQRTEDLSWQMTNKTWKLVGCLHASLNSRLRSKHWSLDRYIFESFM